MPPTTPTTETAGQQAGDVRDLVTQLAAALASRTFSPRIKLLDTRQVCEATGLHKNTIDKMLARGEFPKPLGGIGKRVWREATLIAWMDRNDPNLKEG